MQLNLIPTDTLWEIVEGIALKQEASGVLSTIANLPTMHLARTTVCILSAWCDLVCRDGMSPNKPR